MRKVVTITIQWKGGKTHTHFKEEKYIYIYPESSIPRVNFCLFLRQTQGLYQRTDFCSKMISYMI